MHSSAFVQPAPVAPVSRMRLFAPPAADSFRPSSEVIVKVWPWVQRKFAALPVALTVPPVEGFSDPKARVDDAVMTAQMPSTLAETLTVWVPAAPTTPDSANAATANAILGDVL